MPGHDNGVGTPQAKLYSRNPNFIGVLLTWIGFVCIVIKLHYHLPTPVAHDVDARGLPTFNERRALDIIHDLSVGVGYRIVGTEEMEATHQYMLDLLEAQQRTLASSPLGDLHQMEIWHQTGSGSHKFSLIDRPIYKRYHNLTNIVVRLSAGTAASKADAILVNSHLDSTLPSPGAADDLAGVVVMLELMRIILASDTPLTHSIVLLFNGAEESFQDASHMYITQHETAPSVRAVINLEACGTGGPEILFQATSTEMIKAYSHAPRPYATVFASEIFGTGVVSSDTDFIQFQQHGNLTGLDMALVGNSYLYHTRLDVPANIEPGALTHMHDNVLAALRYLTGPAADLSSLKKAREVTYFSFLGPLGFAMLPASTCTAIYMALVVVLVSYIVFRGTRDRLLAYALATGGVLLSTLLAVASTNVVAFVVSKVLQRSLLWYKRTYLGLILFGPATLSGVLAGQLLIASIARRAGAVSKGDDNAEHVTLVGIATYNVLAALALQLCGVLSSYTLALAGASALLTLIINDGLLSRATSPSARHVSMFAYVLGQLVPAEVGGEGLLGVLDLFVPLMGRGGAEAPADHVIATVIGAVVPAMFPMVLALAHRYGRRSVIQTIFCCWVVTAAVAFTFTRPSYATFDQLHPKRMFAAVFEHLDSKTQSLHVASADSEQSFAPLVGAALAELDVAIPTSFTPAPLSDNATVFDVLHPLGELLYTLHVPLGPLPTSYTSRYTDFAVSAASANLNAVTRQRHIVLEIRHPHIIWTVLAFDAEVVRWDLSMRPPRGRRRHHVKEVSSYGIDRWTLSLSLQLSDAEYEAAQRNAQRAKGQRPADDASAAADRELGGLTVHYSGLEEAGHWRKQYTPGVSVNRDFTKRFDAVLPDFVDAMLLSVVGSSVTI